MSPRDGLDLLLPKFGPSLPTNRDLAWLGCTHGQLAALTTVLVYFPTLSLPPCNLNPTISTTLTRPCTQRQRSQEPPRRHRKLLLLRRRTRRPRRLSTAPHLLQHEPERSRSHNHRLRLHHAAASRLDAFHHHSIPFEHPTPEPEPPITIAASRLLFCVQLQSRVSASAPVFLAR